jgi:hypothetical protein
MMHGRGPARGQPADEVAQVDAHLAEGAGGPGGALRVDRKLP